MHIDPESQYLVINRAASNYLRAIIGSRYATATELKLRGLVLYSANSPSAVLTNIENRPNSEVVETLHATCNGHPVVYKLVHTQKLAPDGRKRVVFLVEVRRQTARELVRK